MTVDRYTKAVLTVIAACLVWLSVNSSMATAPAYAQEGGYTNVVIVGWQDSAGYIKKFPSVVDASRKAASLPVITESR